MRSRSPSIVPGTDQDVYLVVDDFGSLGQAWRETNVGDTDLEMVICDLLEPVPQPGHGGRLQCRGGLVPRRLGGRRP